MICCLGMYNLLFFFVLLVASIDENIYSLPKEVKKVESMKLIKNLTNFDELLRIAKNSAKNALSELQLNNQNAASAGGNYVYFIFY